MTHSYRAHFFHLIWSTKGRLSQLNTDIESNLYPYMKQVIAKKGGNVLEIGGMPDHIHLLLELSRLEIFPSLIRDSKSHSTLWLNREVFPKGPKFSWQEGYGSFSVSYSQIETVSQYIQNQKIHHKKYSFEEEYLELLKRHRLNFNERFVLG